MEKEALHKKEKYIKISLLIFLLLICACIYVLFNHRWQESYKYISPDGNKVILVEYDMVSRPTVYEKDGLSKRMLWKYSGGGFMEQIEWEVIWISNHEIEIGYRDASHNTSEYFNVSLDE